MKAASELKGRSRGRLPAGAALAFLALACSSTLQRQESIRPQLIESEKNAAPTDPSGQATATTAQGASLGVDSPSATSPITGAPSRTGQSAGQPVQIGIRVTKNGDQALQAAGLANLQVGDNIAQANAVIDYINTHGGLNGRKIVPVFAAVDLARSVAGGGAAEEQANCSAWTEDNHVFAATGGAINATPLLINCLAQRGVPFLLSNISVYDQKLFDDSPLLFAPAMLNVSRLAPVHVDRLHALGFFGSGARIGVLVEDSLAGRRYADQILPAALHRYGHRVATREIVSRTPSESGSQIQAAVLRFKAQGITHVFFMVTGGTGGLFFMPAAESQNYRPKYGVSSLDALGVLQAALPAEQLRNATGIGWYPYFDVDGQRDPGTPGRRLCDTIMRQAGQDMSNRTTAAVASGYCDTLFFLKQTMGLATRFTPQALQRAVDTELGSQFVPALTWRTRLGARRHDGVASVRDIAYDYPCRCFRYRGRETVIA